jgi:hypothetical protein
VDTEQVSKEQVMLVALAVVLVVEMVMQTMPEVVLHRHLVKVMLVVVEAVVELTHLAEAAVAEVLAQLVVIVGTTHLLQAIILAVVTVELVQLLQLPVHL